MVSALCLACIAALSACGWRGLNSFTLPGTAGGGSGSYTIQAQMPDVVTIQENTRVRVDDVNYYKGWDWAGGFACVRCHQSWPRALE